MEDGGEDGDVGVLVSVSVGALGWERWDGSDGMDAIRYERYNGSDTIPVMGVRGMVLLPVRRTLIGVGSVR